MRTWLAVLFLAFSSAVAAQADSAKSADALRALAWQKGPAEGRVGEKASIQIPQGHVFLDAQNTKRFLELSGNPPRDGHYLLAPQSLDWFAVFSFNPVGYVKDDEKINPDELLKSLKDSDAASNEERKRLGMEALYTDGWHVAPHYDGETKRLEWGVRVRTASNQQVVNYTSRLLGRTGVMNAVLVSDPQTLNSDTTDFKNALRGFSFVGGEKYAEFKAGDKVAEYGLAALVVGGAAAAAAKTGILKSLGKFIWVIVIGAFAGIWGLLKRILGRKSDPNTPQ